MIPLISFSLIHFLKNLITKISYGEDVSFHWVVKRCLSDFFNGPWFLWAIWLCSLIVLIVRSYMKDSILVYLAGFIISYIVPEYGQICLYKFMYPYFVCGYLVGKKTLFKKEKPCCKGLNAFAFVIVLIVLYSFILLDNYSLDTYVYISGSSVLDKVDKAYFIKIYAYRITIGFLGSLFMTVVGFIFNKYIKNKLIRTIILNIGRNTIGIYLISSELFSFGRPLLAKIDKLSYRMILSESFLFLVASLFLIYLIKKSKIAAMFFLGSKI